MEMQQQNLNRHKLGRVGQIVAILIVFVSVGVFRVVHDRKSASDIIKYSNTEEAVEQMARILSKTPKRDQLATLMKYLKGDSPGMRYAAVDRLEFQQGNGIADALGIAYNDSSTEVRDRVLDIMPQFDAQRGYRLQLTSLQDEDSWVRDHALLLLASNLQHRGSYVDKRAVPVLMRTITDADLNLAPIAMPVLMRLTGITGKDWRYSILANDAVKSKVNARWLKWWAANSASWPAKEFEALAPDLPTRTDPAPDFLVKDIDGQRISLGDLQGKVVLLNFWGTWCPPCQAEMPALVDLDNSYRNKGLEMVGIAVKEKGADTLRDWCSAHGVKYRQVLDADTIAQVYGDCFEVPVSVLIDKHGKIRRRWEGERDYDTFRLAVERLLKE